MKVLLDENLDHRLRGVLAPHDVVTTVYAGWSGLRNGELLKAAEEHGFEVFVTADRNLTYQQNLAAREIAIVVLTAHSWMVIQPHLGRIQDDRSGDAGQFPGCGLRSFSAFLRC